MNEMDAMPAGKALELLLETTVAEVTLQEDRAQVVRRGKLELPKGRVKVRVENVAPILADKTLTAEVVSGPEGVHVNHVRVTRGLIRMIEHRPADLADVEERRRKVERERKALGVKEHLLGMELEDLEKVAGLCMEEFSSDVAWGRSEPEVWTAQLARMSERERTARDGNLALQIRKNELQEEGEDLRRRLEAMRTPSSDFRASIEVELSVETPGTRMLEFTYLVPGACWRPQHTARLVRTDSAVSVRFKMDGCVWQNTGEDWEDTWLVFSTQRPSLGTEPPVLGADILQVRDKEVRMEVEAREQKIETAGLGVGARREAPEVPGIDDGGEVLVLKSGRRATVPSDGRPYRVAIREFETPATSELEAMPERAAAVIRKCVLTNTSDRPVLAGPVDLVADSGYVGRTSVLYVAPGEKFELGFGPDPEIRIHRRVDVVPHEKGMLSRWIKTDLAVTLSLSNIGAEDKTFEVTERIPISEVEKVKISFDAEKTSPGAKPDENGFVKWTVKLGAGDRTERKLHYTIEKHHDVTGI